MSDKNYHPEAQQEVTDALLCFLSDDRRSEWDSAHTDEDRRLVHYNSTVLKDAIVVIMDAFGFDAKID